MSNFIVYFSGLASVALSLFVLVLSIVLYDLDTISKCVNEPQWCVIEHPQLASAIKGE